MLGRDDILDSLAQIPVIPLSSQSRSLSWQVPLTPQDGVPTECVLKPEWIRWVDRTHIGPYITSLPERRWPEVRVALLAVLGFEH